MVEDLKWVSLLHCTWGIVSSFPLPFSHINLRNRVRCLSHDCYVAPLNPCPPPLCCSAGFVVTCCLQVAQLLCPFGAPLGGSANSAIRGHKESQRVFCAAAADEKTELVCERGPAAMLRQACMKGQALIFCSGLGFAVLLFCLDSYV